MRGIRSAQNLRENQRGGKLSKDQSYRFKGSFGVWNVLVSMLEPLEFLQMQALDRSIYNAFVGRSQTSWKNDPKILAKGLINRAALLLKLAEQNDFAEIDNARMLKLFETALRNAGKAENTTLKAQVYALKSYYFYKVPAVDLPELKCWVNEANRFELQKRLSQFRQLRLAHTNHQLSTNLPRENESQELF